MFRIFGVTFVLLVLFAGMLVLETGCSKKEEADSSKTTTASQQPNPVSPERLRGIPSSVQPCYECHQQIVDAYMQHGMAWTVGEAGLPEPGSITNPKNGNVYEIRHEKNEAWLYATNKEGGQRIQRLVGRIGSGLFDRSWVGAEINPFTFLDTGRLFFAPVETVTNHGLALSPFELTSPSAGIDFGLNMTCLTCHTQDSPQTFTEAAFAPDRLNIYPDNALGPNLFKRLTPILCEACHGDAREHLTIMSGLPDPDQEDLGLVDLKSLPPAQQLDLCAKCHLQGEVRFDLIGGSPDLNKPMMGQIPALVAAHESDDFRFVSQMERLALSACFKEDPSLTCTTCHDPHTSFVEQDPASFDAACKSCHTDLAMPHTSRSVASITGSPQSSPEGCFDCHMRRSQPFDLPHLLTIDHNIQRNIASPKKEIPYRQYTDAKGPLKLFEDPRLAAALNTPGGKKWRDGILGMAYVTMGRNPEALKLFEAFPAPGTPQAVEPTSPPLLVPLETDATFHHTRGLAFLSVGKPQEAAAALSDALSIDPYYAPARMERARIRFLAGDNQGALEDTEFILKAHPNADAPWNLRAHMAMGIKVPAMAAAALEVSTSLWPSNATTWQQLGWLYQQTGEPDKAQMAFDRAVQLNPAIAKALSLEPEFPFQK